MKLLAICLFYQYLCSMWYTVQCEMKYLFCVWCASEKLEQLKFLFPTELNTLRGCISKNTGTKEYFVIHSFFCEFLSKSSRILKMTRGKNNISIYTIFSRSICILIATFSNKLKESLLWVTFDLFVAFLLMQG